MLEKGHLMAGVKTAISVEKKLFEQVNQLAKEKHISRSRLFVLAVAESNNHLKI